MKPHPSLRQAMPSLPSSGTIPAVAPPPILAPSPPVSIPVLPSVTRFRARSGPSRLGNALDLRVIAVPLFQLVPILAPLLPQSLHVLLCRADLVLHCALPDLFFHQLLSQRLLVLLRSLVHSRCSIDWPDVGGDGDCQITCLKKWLLAT